MVVTRITNSYQLTMAATTSEESLISMENDDCGKHEYEDYGDSSSPDLVRLDADMNDIVIDDLNDTEPTSAILNLCQRKFLTPYINILAIIGLRPITIDSSDLIAYIGHIQTVLVVVILTTGYFIQYFSYFRRDRGFTNTTYPPSEPPVEFYTPREVTVYYGETIFVYGVSSVLHFTGFLSAMYVFRIADNEQLQNLVERVFILHNVPNKLIFSLWMQIINGVLWLLIMTLYLIVMEDDNIDTAKIVWLGESTKKTQIIAKILLVAVTFVQDLVQVIVLTSYSLQCYLLRRYVYILKGKLLQNTIDSLDWMREMVEFRKLLSHLNTKTAIPVCIYTILNISYTFAAIIYFIRIYDQFTSNKVVIMALINIFWWLILGLYPFFQASALTYACESAQISGHQVRIKPYVHYNTSLEELNSILLYSSSLRMSAKLYKMPIHGSYVFFILLCIIVSTLTFGMCLNISLGIIQS